MAEKKLKGTMHLHTNLSHDGTLPFEKIVPFLKNKGYDFLLFTEHSYDLDIKKTEIMVQACRELSDDNFLVVPGVEYRCHDKIDILGYGAIEPINSDNPLEVIAHIHKQGGVSVWAHPTIHDYPYENSWLGKLDGFEIWNVSNEGKFLPSPKTLIMYQRLKIENPNLLAFCGHDLHRLVSYCDMSSVISVEKLTREEILAKLKSGEFETRSPHFSCNSQGDIALMDKMKISVGRPVLNILRGLRDLTRK
ncbi:MAG: hypothetical protein ABIJ45_01295 [Candidatus Zixiibacteriota bacterium]